MTVTNPNLARALNEALGTFSAAGSGYPRGMSAAILMTAPRGLARPPATVTLVRNFDGDVIGVTLQDTTADDADLPDALTPGNDQTNGTIGNPARADMIDTWHALHDANQWSDRDMLIQVSAAGGSVVTVCDADAPNPEWERAQFLAGLLDGLRLLAYASQ